MDNTINRIILLAERWADFWRNAHGWAPDSAADLLSDARLDLQVGLARCLRDWASGAKSDAHLVLAWANLGALVEGALMLMCCVFYEDYQRADDKIAKMSPDTLTLEPLRVFFSKHIWVSGQSKRWDPWLCRVLQRRNAIHAFRRRELGSFEEFDQCVKDCLDLMCEIDQRLPYPY